MYTAVLLDVDGTLVDSNDAHAHAWVAAFAERGIHVDFTQVRRSIGMGGDKLMPAVSGIEEDSPDGKRISRRRGEIFQTEWLPRLQPFRDAARLVSALKERGLTVVAASSAKKDELRPLLDDVVAAQRAGVRTIAFRCGGWSDADLTGALAVYDGPWDLVPRLDAQLSC